MTCKSVQARVLVVTIAPGQWRQSLAVKSLIEMFEGDSRLSTIVADALRPLPSEVRRMNFDVVILTPMVLSARHDSKKLQRVKDQLGELKTSRSLRVAMPQDDYDGSHILDTWLDEWDTHLVFTPCPDNWSTLYPLCHTNRRLRKGYTSYISKHQVASPEEWRSWECRIIDVGYRASRLPYFFGALGQTKTEIVKTFGDKVVDQSRFSLDFAVGEKSFLSGKRWIRFIGDSRFMLASPSGSSIVDPLGDLRRLALETIDQRLSMQEFFQLASSRNCYWIEQDNTAISPRNVEAALHGTAQIAVQHHFSGVLEPDRDYIPLSDKSLDTVLTDEFNWNEVRRNAYEAILSVRRLRSEFLVEEILAELPSSRVRTRATCEISRLVISRSKLNLWMIQRLRAFVLSSLSWLRSWPSSARIIKSLKRRRDDERRPIA